MVGLELGLHQDHDVGVRGSQATSQIGRDRAQRDECQVGADEREPSRRGGEGANVLALVDGDARVGSQPLVELPVADVDGDHPGRAALQEAVGEAARRCTGVQRHPTGDRHGEARQGGVELLPAPADEARRGADQLDRLTGVHLAGCLLGHGAGDQDPARGDGGLRGGATTRQAPADELRVEPATRG